MSTLEKLCLDLIVEKFERFYVAFTVLKDDNLQRNFEFLQRRFSVKLATALYEKRKLKDEYFELLLNEHLNFLDGKWFENSRYQNAMEDIFRRLPNLRRICFNRCGDEIPEYLAKFCPKLVEINVRLSRVTDNGFEYLCKNENGLVPCSALKNLFVKHSRITDRGVESLIRNLPSLESIDYPNVPLVLHYIHQENLSHFKEVHCYGLVKLNLLLCNIKYILPNYTEILKTCFTVCPKLESLACCITNRRELELFVYSRLKKLHLQFKIPKGPSYNINNFLKLNGSNLTALKISNCTMSVSLLAIYCPALKEFDAYRVNLTSDDNVQPIFPFLTKCTLSHIDSSSTKAVCVFLFSSPMLESVSFTSCVLCLEMKTQILTWCKNPSAKKIDFWCFDLEIEFLRDILLSCTSLEELGLTECYADVSDTDMREMVDILQNLAKSLPNKPKIRFFPLFYQGHGGLKYEHL